MGGVLLSSTPKFAHSMDILLRYGRIALVFSSKRLLLSFRAERTMCNLRRSCLDLNRPIRVQGSQSNKIRCTARAVRHPLVATKYRLAKRIYRSSTNGSHCCEESVRRRQSAGHRMRAHDISHHSQVRHGCKAGEDVIWQRRELVAM